jgi:hypothetical protein
MKTTGVLLASLAAIAGCVTAPAPVRSTAVGNVFSGEVWNWDEQASTVTLRQDGGQTVRVVVPRETFCCLNLHQRTTVRGTLAPPAELVHTVQPAGAMTAVPRGAPATTEAAGTVSAADPAGRVVVGTPQGPIVLWLTAGADRRFPPGTPVRVRLTVQPVDMVAAAGAATTDAAPAALAGGEPGDYALVTGAVRTLDPQGLLVVDSPQGPIQVAAGTLRPAPGSWVQVRASVHPAR